MANEKSQTDETPTNNSKPKQKLTSQHSNSSKSAKQKSLANWSVDDVLRWLRKHIGEGYYIAYGSLFKNQDINGAALMRLTEYTLQRMGVDNHLHRNELWCRIQVLRLKSDQVEVSCERGGRDK